MDFNVLEWSGIEFNLCLTFGFSSTVKTFNKDTILSLLIILNYNN